MIFRQTVLFLVDQHVSDNKTGDCSSPIITISIIHAALRVLSSAKRFYSALHCIDVLSCSCCIVAAAAADGCCCCCWWWWWDSGLLLKVYCSSISIAILASGAQRQELRLFWYAMDDGWQSSLFHFFSISFLCIIVLIVCCYCFQILVILDGVIIAVLDCHYFIGW